MTAREIVEHLATIERGSASPGEREAAEWIAARRWFRAKTRPLAGVREVDRAALGGEAALVVAQVTYRDGGEPDHYLVPLVGGHEPRDGEGAWSSIVGAMARGAVLPAEHGRFVGGSIFRRRHRLPAVATEVQRASQVGWRRFWVDDQLFHHGRATTLSGICRARRR